MDVYRLDGKVPVLCKTEAETKATLRELFENNSKARKVAHTELKLPRRIFTFWRKRKPVVVSTVFLVFDHAFGHGSRPQLFETMVFGGKLDNYMERYPTWIMASAGHDEIVRRVRKAERI